MIDKSYLCNVNRPREENKRPHVTCKGYVRSDSREGEWVGKNSYKCHSRKETRENERDVNQGY
jgi:hypothetical protein